jgi:hypothetical protein
MATLSREQRKLLENTVVAARGVAERGAEKALTALGVADRRPPASLSEAEKTLRRQLRAHGHQLGDAVRNDEQDTSHLKQACAYEHWHRMLFARFLAENDLLMSPEYGVAMSLAEIQETARAQKQDWLTLASDYAQRMLLEVFRPDDPVLQIVMPPETRQALEEKLALLPTEIFWADDSLGWVYQFWQRDEKERVNKSEVKIGADELSPVTQLFTEDYMVLFLLHNTLGAWWTAKRIAEGKTHGLPGYEWTYLRLNEDGSPVAGNFDGWPKRSAELRVLDPCMGSGHFLTFALPILARMRQEEEGTSVADAVPAVLADNLFGLELDARCSQIAAFNLALTAWRMVGRPVPLPTLNLACSGLGINASKESWTALAGDNGLLRDTLAELYITFQKAPTLGSLIDPSRVGRPLLTSKFDEVRPVLERALATEHQSDESRELVIAAKGVFSAARILSEKFTLVTTNVPYVGRGKQDDELKEYCSEFYSEAKADLATCFIDRCLRLCAEGGSTGLVTPQNWLFLKTYAKLRKRLLQQFQWDFAVRLGPNAFQIMNWWFANTALVSLTRSSPSGQHNLIGWDVSDLKAQSAKADALSTRAARPVNQVAQISNPDATILFEEGGSGHQLSNFAKCTQGMITGDNGRFRLCFWEMSPIDERTWTFLQAAPTRTTPVSGCSFLVRWEQGHGDLARSPQARICGQPAWGKVGVAIAVTRQLYRSRFFGHFFDCTLAALTPTDPRMSDSVLAFVLDDDFPSIVRRTDQALSVTESSFTKVQFDADHWGRVASQIEPIALRPVASPDPTQWVFQGRPHESETPLQVAVARLLGYRWPRQTGSDFPYSHILESDDLEKHADVDGVVALSALAGEDPAAQRLRNLLEEDYGKEWSSAKLVEILGGVTTLDQWLREKFFEEHCTIFHNRPFIWHVWDGRKDGYHALVNYHKLTGPNGEGRKTLEKLIYTSLGDWISRQRAEVATGVDGAEARLSAALHLQSELENILTGEPPYDIFVRWKPLHEQPMGWEPDINDGVRPNMRPWLHAKPYQSSKRDACILRVTPINLPLGKDRGKEPVRDKIDFPWFADSQDRSNDAHLTLEQKRAAKVQKKA